MGTRMEVAQLESRMNCEDYRKLQALFLDSSGAPRSLSRAEFIHLAWSSVGRGSREEYGLLFDCVVVSQERGGLLLDIDTVKREGKVDWKGLCSFLLLELSEKVKNRRTSRVPCWTPPRTVTCPHRDTIQKVLHLQSSGQYLTVSKGGTVGLWDGEDMSLLLTHRLQNSTVASKDLWVTDVVFLRNLNKVAVSFTSKELCFYDTQSKQDFGCKYKIQGLTFTPWCLDYWTDPSQSGQAVLTIGDTGGQVSGIHFTSAQISLFERLGLSTDSDSADIILWDELVKGKHRTCYVVTHQAHMPAWVRKVSYIGCLEAFVSCSTRPQSSMVIGWREKDSRGLRVSSFATKRGVWDMDHHRRLNLIATAGLDHMVLLWNPSVISHPVCAFSGHTSPVTAVCFMQTKHQLLSYSKDKVLCLWDISSQLCLQRLAGSFPKTQEDAHTSLFLCEERQLLLLSFNSQLIMLETVKEERRTSSHEHSVTCVLYNSLFRQVVSGDSASSVICWLADTGQKVKQFYHCHGNSEISTMALDGTQTRLFTAASDGEVKVWDFNGRCLHRMNAGRGAAVNISQILLLKRSILVMGWERMLTVFRLHSFSQSFVEPSEWKGGAQHRSNVLCAAFKPPHVLVTGSYDGEILVWNSNTETVLRKLHPHKGDSHLCMSSKDDSGNSVAITQLIFIPGRTSEATATGADLVSCGVSGLVRLWSSSHSCPLGQFAAHDKELGSIVMSISPCGSYLVTAGSEGTLKTWELQNYCIVIDDRTIKKSPELLSSFRPHHDRVTHLDICFHGDGLLLLSASYDCTVALSRLPGETIGLFGQEELWHLKQPQPLHSQNVPKWSRNDTEEAGDPGSRGKESPPDPEANTSAEDVE